MREQLLDLLTDAFEDEIQHLELRMIRDTQAPRFEAIRDTHPEIYEDFMKARTGPHEILLRNRRKRVDILTKLIETCTEPVEKSLMKSPLQEMTGVKESYQRPFNPITDDPTNGYIEGMSGLRCLDTGRELYPDT